MAVVKRGDAVQAEVAGSDFAPYDVRVSFAGADITSATCSCPYEWGGWCKHIVAVLLTCVREPDAVRESPALEEILSGLDREQLQNLLLMLAGIPPWPTSLRAKSRSRRHQTPARQT